MQTKEFDRLHTKESERKYFFRCEKLKAKEVFVLAANEEEAHERLEARIRKEQKFWSDSKNDAGPVSVYPTSYEYLDAHPMRPPLKVGVDLFPLVNHLFSPEKKKIITEGIQAFPKDRQEGIWLSLKDAIETAGPMFTGPSKNGWDTDQQASSVDMTNREDKFLVSTPEDPSQVLDEAAKHIISEGWVLVENQEPFGPAKNVIAKVDATVALREVAQDVLFSEEDLQVYRDEESRRMRERYKEHGVKFWEDESQDYTEALTDLKMNALSPSSEDENEVDWDDPKKVKELLDL